MFGVASGKKNLGKTSMRKNRMSTLKRQEALCLIFLCCFFHHQYKTHFDKIDSFIYSCLFFSCPQNSIFPYQAPYLFCGDVSFSFTLSAKVVRLFFPHLATEINVNTSEKENRKDVKVFFAPWKRIRKVVKCASEWEM